MKESKKELRQSKEIRVGSRRNFSLARKSGRKRRGRGHPSCSASSVNCGQNLGIASTKFSRGGRMSRASRGSGGRRLFRVGTTNVACGAKRKPAGQKTVEETQTVSFSLSSYSAITYCTTPYGSLIPTPLSACSHTATLCHHQHHIPPTAFLSLRFPFPPAAPSGPSARCHLSIS